MPGFPCVGPPTIDPPPGLEPFWASSVSVPNKRHDAARSELFNMVSAGNFEFCCFLPVDVQLLCPRTTFLYIKNKKSFIMMHPEGNFVV